MTAPSDNLNDLRQRVLAGENIPPEEYAEIIASLRAKRLGDVTISSEKKASAAKAKKPAAAPVDLDSLFRDVGL